MTTALSPRLAIWGTFDVANFGDHLFPRIFEHEMRRRLPTAQVQAFSPLGHLHPLPFDGGLMVEPLGEWSQERLAELAIRHDLVTIGGGEIIHTHDDVYANYYGTSIEEARRLQPSKFFIEGLGPALEESCPVTWHSVGIPFDLDEGPAARVRSALEKRAYVSVRDHISHDRLLRAGVTCDVAVVPDSAFLVDRVVTDEEVERRLAYLRGIEAYPPSERPLIVQGSRALLPHVEDIARNLTSAIAETGDMPIVLLETGRCHGDEDFAAAIAPYLSGHVYRMPASPLIADIVAAIVHSRGFVGISLHGNVIAFAHGLPSAILDLGLGYSELGEFAALVHGEDALVRTPADLLPAILRVLSGTPPWNGLGEITGRIDSHFDTLAELAEQSALERLDRSPFVRSSAAAKAFGEAREGETALRRAFEARGRRLVEQRLRLADEIERLEQELRAKEQELSEERLRYANLQQKLEASEIEIDRLRSEIQGLLSSRSFRYTAPFRAIFSRLSRLVR